jgi:hypothetical protein
MAHNHGSSGMADMPGMEGSATSMNHGGLEMKMFFHGTVGGDGEYCERANRSGPRGAINDQ